MIGSRAVVVVLAILAFFGASGCSGAKAPPTPTPVPPPTVAMIPVVVSARALAHDGQFLWMVDPRGAIVAVQQDGTVMKTFHAGANPSSLLFWNDHLWLADSDCRCVIKMNTSGVVVSETSIDGTPGAMAADGEALWVTDLDHGTVVRLSLSGRIENVVPVGPRPVSLVVLEDAVWVATSGADTVARVDTTSLEVASFPARSSPSPAYGSSGSPGPDAIAFDGHSLWLGFAEEGVVTRIAQNGQSEIFLPLGQAAVTALAAVGEIVWVAHSDGRLTRITGDLRDLLKVDLRGRPAAVVVHDGTLWVATEDPSGLVRISN